MNTLCDGAASFLERVYRDDIASFPFTTHLRGDGYESVYAHSRTIRSTINCLLGMQEAKRHDPSHPFLERTDAITARFLLLHEGEVANHGDLGLLVALLTEAESDPVAARRLLGRLIEQASDEARLRRLNIQDLAWLLWGSVSAARKGLVEAEPAAHMLFRLIRKRYCRPGEALPRNDMRRARGGIVSFGASVYFAYVTYCYGQLFDSEPAMDLFRGGVDALLRCQRTGGEWPWLLSSRDGRPLDVYPVFSVHQHSMAMFFLLPARKEGVPGVGPAISRSMSWMSGKNQLGVSMVRHDPFFTYRSIERKAVWPRAQRYLRARQLLATRQAAAVVPNNRVMLNTESRSYELGWALYLLSDQPTLAGFG